MAEITIGHWRGLGLIARTELDEGQLDVMGRLIRDRLRTPFDSLKTEFDWVWANTSAGHALSILAGRNSESLFFAPATSLMIRRAFKTEGDVGEFARHELRDRRDLEFDLMLAELSDRPGAPTGDMAKVAA